MKTLKEIIWVDWICPICEAEMSDPSDIKQTICSNNHTVFLGKVHENNHGYSRRAFKTKGERRRRQHEEKLHHEAAMIVMNAAFSDL